MKIIKISFAVLCISLLLYAFFGEKFNIFSLSNASKTAQISGSDFIETATFDGLMLKEAKLFDIHSLTPGILQEKDCST